MGNKKISQTEIFDNLFAHLSNYTSYTSRNANFLDPSKDVKLPTFQRYMQRNLFEILLIQAKFGF